MLTEYYRHQGAFSKSYCSRCLMSFGNISEKKYWRKTKSDLRKPFFSVHFLPTPFPSGMLFGYKIRLRLYKVVHLVTFQVKIQVLLYYTK